MKDVDVNYFAACWEKGNKVRQLPTLKNVETSSYFCRSKVSKLRNVILGQEDIERFEVPMYDVLGVQVVYA